MKILVLDVNEPFKIDFANALSEKAELYGIIFIPFKRILNAKIENKLITKINRIYFLPRYYSNPISKWLFNFQFSILIKKINPDVLIITSPFYKDLLDYDLKVKVYFVFDNYKLYKGWNVNLVDKFEKEISEKADYIFTSSNSLKDYLTKHYNLSGDIIKHIPNATNDNYYYNSSVYNSPLKNLQRPIAGCIGVIDDKRLDMGLLEKLIDKFPSVSFVFVGNVKVVISKGKYKNIFNSKNVFLTGRQSRDKIPEYLWSFDVCLLPMQNNDFNYFISPVRLFDYIASGKPIISTYIPEVEFLFKDLVNICKDHADFLKKFDELYKVNFIDNMNELRLQKATEHTWKSRSKFIIKLLENKLKENK